MIMPDTIIENQSCLTYAELSELGSWIKHITEASWQWQSKNG
jgi:hypothetical protein